jgi:ParB family chromosome partitioning protein
MPEGDPRTLPVLEVMVVTHELKCERGPFMAIAAGHKTFEYRKNDRDYNVNDLFILNEVDEVRYTGNKSGPWVITYILYGPDYGIPAGFCVFAFVPYRAQPWRADE